jgi:hypothetical protein
MSFLIKKNNNNVVCDVLAWQCVVCLLGDEVELGGASIQPAQDIRPSRNPQA